MAKHIQGKDGKMAGSIGDGKSVVPTEAPTMDAAVLRHVLQRRFPNGTQVTLDDVYTAYQQEQAVRAEREATVREALGTSEETSDPLEEINERLRNTLRSLNDTLAGSAPDAQAAANATRSHCKTCGSEIAHNLPWFGECKKCYDREDTCTNCAGTGCAYCDDDYGYEND